MKLNQEQAEAILMGTPDTQSRSHLSQPQCGTSNVLVDPQQRRRALGG
jgi:hypothetical protein